MTERSSPKTDREWRSGLPLRLAGLSVLAALLGACAQTPQTTGASDTTATVQPAGGRPVARTYTNPLRVNVPGGSSVESCADPDIIRGSGSDRNWYLFCTTDPHNAADRDANGNSRFHLISMAKSSDLVNWTYVGDAFNTRPAWVSDNGGLWAPNIEFMNGKYYLYYTASETKAGGSAIGVATSDHPTGPWTDKSAPVVEPHPADCCPDSRRWTYDSDVIVDDAGTKWLYYGSYFGGLSVRQLSADGFTTQPGSQTPIAVANRYEGSHVFKRGGYYYLFASATNCCNGPLTGYSVFVGRSESPTGPFVDRDGVSFLSGRVGGTPFLSMNGNRWVGPGHNSVFTDAGGQDWTVYHAVNRFDPYLAEAGGINKRPVLLDPVVWKQGWPSVRGGLWASDRPMSAPAAQEGERSAYRSERERPERPGRLISSLSTDFAGATLPANWSWVREPANGTFGLENGELRFDTQAADLYVNSNNASILNEAAPRGEYVVETKVRLNVPAEGCCFNFVQAGLVVFKDDDNFVKLAPFSNFETRQIEFAKEFSPVPANEPRYGNTVLAAPGETTWLRIVKRDEAGEEHYTAYSSLDGKRWTRGGTWTHHLGSGARLGLVSMGGAGFQAHFDYVRVYELK